MTVKTKDEKKITIRLPKDDPIWDLPEGERSKQARELIEIGRRVRDIGQEFLAVLVTIEKRLDSVEEVIKGDMREIVRRVAGIEEALKNGMVLMPESPHIPGGDTGKDITVSAPEIVSRILDAVDDF